MSVTSVTCVEVSGDITEEGHRTYVKTFEIITNSASDGPYTCMTSGSLPSRGSYYAYGSESDVFAMCKRVGNFKLREVDKIRKVWRCEAHYSTEGMKDDPNNEPGNPLDWAWKISGGPNSDRKVMSKDIDDRALQNSSDEPFEPLPEIIAPNAMISLQKNTATIDLSTWWDYQGAVNDADIWGLGAARKARINSWTWEVVFYGQGQQYISNKWEVEINRNKFQYEPVDQGFRKKTGQVDGNGFPKYSQLRVDGEIPSKPVPLNGYGDQLLLGVPVVFFDGIGGNPDPFKLEDEVDFSAVFPNPLPGPFV